MLASVAAAGADAPWPITVGLSGGADSSLLLWLSVQASGAGAVQALHVHHGLHPRADDWAAHCRRFCESLGVKLQVIAVDARPPAGQAPEAWARQHRYAAFAAALPPAGVLLTAHHRDDNDETVLLRLLRGAGPHGLTGIPAGRPLGVGSVRRPLLGFPRQALQAVARAAGLDWVEDPGNTDPRVPRSHLRNAVLPALAARWPGLPASMARHRQLQADAAENLDALASMDLAAAASGNRLAISPLRALGPARQRNALRAWLGACGAVPDWHVIEQVRGLFDAGPDRHGGLRCGPLQLFRYRDTLHAERLPPAPADCRWTPPAPLRLPGGTLWAEPVTGEGLAARHADGGLLVGWRRGGERMRLSGRGHSSSVKKLLQQAGVPPWRRGLLPLLRVQGQLAAIPGIGVCEAFAAGPGEAGYRLMFDAGDVV